MSKNKKKNKKIERKENKNKNTLKKYNLKWVFIISIWTFLLAICVSLISESIMRKFNILMAFITLIVIIIMGVVFDIIGISVAVANEAPFHSMAANRIKVARYAVKLIRNAGPVSNFCNDVIGDIAGIVSGAAGTIIVLKLSENLYVWNIALISIIMSGLIAAFTVGGKAYGKEIAINNADKIVYFTAKILMYLHLKFGIEILPDRKKKEKKG